MARALRLIVIASMLLLTTAGKAGAAEIIENPGSGGVVIAVRGEFEIGDDRKFDQVAQRYSKGAVYLESRGGDLVTGISIGESIRLKGFDTFLPPEATCASSCALAWLGGARRFLSATSRLGFHSAYRMDGPTARETGIGNAVVGAYLTRIGLPVSAVIYITKASPDTMTWLTPADAQKAGIELSFVEDVFPNKSADLITPAQSQPPPEARSPSFQPTQRQEAAPPPTPPEKSIVTGRYYKAVSDNIIELLRLPNPCGLADAEINFIGKVARRNFSKNGVVVESFVLDKIDGIKEIIKIGSLDDLSMVDLDSVLHGLQTILHEGQEVSGSARLCGAGLFLERVKPQGSRLVLTANQTSKPSQKTRPAQEESSLNKKPVVKTAHYKTLGGKALELFKLSDGSEPYCEFDYISGTVAQLNLMDDGFTIKGFILEQLNGRRQYINVEIPSDIVISEVKVVIKSLHSILRQGQSVSGEVRRCGAAGRMLTLESLKES